MDGIPAPNCGPVTSNQIEGDLHVCQSHREDIPAHLIHSQPGQV